MHHLLQDTITAVRRRARRLTLAHAVSWVVVMAVLASIGFALLDSYLRIEHLAARFLFSVVWALAIEQAVRHYLYPWFQRRSSDVAVAQRIQNRYPELKDELATAVEFLTQSEDEQGAGSGALRRAVVVDATSKLDRIDTSDVLDTSPTRKALIAGSTAAVVALALIVLVPTTARIAMTRLAIPWSDVEWPRQHNLAFRDPPRRLALGTEFEVELFDQNGTLPEQVEIQFRFNDDGTTRTQTEKMRRVGDVMVAHRTNVRNAFSYRATGGDDDSMAWHELEVLEPPRIESLTVTLTPPPYTLWQPSTSSGQVRALVGTQMAVQATSTKPLKQATLRFEDGTGIAGVIGEDGLSFAVPATDGEPVLIKQSGTYWFELVDTQDMTSGSDTRWRIEAIPDEPPSVTVEDPRQDVFVTAAATVPVRVLVKDQLAIRDVELVYLRGDDSAEGVKRVALYSAGDEGSERAVPELEDTDREDHRELIDYAWNLEQLKEPLAPGALVTFHAEASDFRPQIGRSQPSLRIHVISDEDFQDRLTQQYSRIVGELADKLKDQQRARQKIAELEIQLEEVGMLPQSDVNKLQQTDLQQRNIRRSLAQDNDSVLRQIDSLLSELKNNQVDNPEVTDRLSNLQKLIEGLDATHLSAAEQQLTTAIKESQTHARRQQQSTQQDQPQNKQQQDAEQKEKQEAPPKTGSGDPAEHPAQTPLEQAGQEQDQVIAKIESALGDLERWSEYRGLARDLTGLKREMEELQDRTATTGAPLLGRDAKDLKRQESTDLLRLRQQQSGLRQRFDKLVQKMKTAADKLDQTDPAAAGPLSDAVHHARETGISADMRDAAQNIEKNQIARATGQQREIAEQMGEMLDMLSNRGEDRLARRVKKLRKAEKDLADLRKRQEGLRKKMEAAADKTDQQQRQRDLQRLSREQKKLQEEMGRLMRRLERLQAERAGAKMSQAGAAAGKAGQAGEAGDAAEAGKQAGQAEKDLEEAQKELAKARRHAEMDLAQQLLSRIEDDIKAVQEQQQELLNETRRLQTIREEFKQLTRGQKSSVADLSREQETLRETTDEMTTDLAAAEAFALALKHAARSMKQAAAKLANIETDETTQRQQESALARLQLVLDAIEEKKPEDDGKGGGQAGEGEGGQPPSGEGGIRSIAEIRLLRLMQTDLNLRTDELHEQIANQPPSVEQLEQLAGLAEEQGELAELTFRLLEEADAGPEDELEEPAEEVLDEEAAVDAGAEETGEKEEVEEVTP